MGNRPLMQARSWYYNLARVEPELIAKVDADVLVIDYAKFGGKVPLTPAEVAAMKTGPTGRKRLVISYFSIGEAEEYRFYWKPEWKETPPAWDAGENCAWPRAHMVRFWHDSWKETILRGPNAYLKQIIAAGFDGVYLDRVDVYENQTEPGLDTREEMKKLVAELAEIGRGLKPGFLVIPQNAEDLLMDRDYRRIIDGLGKESLLYSGEKTDQAQQEQGHQLVLGAAQHLALGLETGLRRRIPHAGTDHESCPQGDAPISASCRPSSIARSTAAIPLIPRSCARPAATPARPNTSPSSARTRSGGRNF